MALTFQILPGEGIVYVKYTGVMTVQESFAQLAAYQAHPDFRPTHKHLVDLADITDFERNFPEIIRLQATKVEMVSAAPTPTLLAYYAPNAMAQAAARAALKSWEGLSHVIPLLAKSESEALSLIGSSATSLDVLLQSA
ncbi:MAG: hypothetical protein ACRBCL_11760 [Maritimibacter sp.]